MIYTQPVVYEFPHLKVPTLLVIGQRDRTALGARVGVQGGRGHARRLSRRSASKAAAAIPGATLVEIPGVGHLPQVEAFEAYSQALAQFLP